MPPDACACLSPLCARHQRRARVVDLLLGRDAVAEQPLGAVELGARVDQRGVGLLALRRRLRDVLQQLLGLDVRQRLAHLHAIALGDEDAIDAALRPARRP